MVMPRALGVFKLTTSSICRLLHGQVPWQAPVRMRPRNRPRVRVRHP